MPKWIVKEGKSVLGSRGLKGPGAEITAEDCGGDAERFEEMKKGRGSKESVLEKVGDEKAEAKKAEEQEALDAAAAKAEAGPKKKKK